MRRWFKITLLALGVVLGYGLAFRSMRHHHGYGYGYGHDGWCDHHGWERPPQKAPPATEPPAPQ